MKLGNTLWRLSFTILVCLALALAATNAQSKKAGGDARTAVEKFFALLKSQQYAALYDFLPGQLQQQLTREQLTQSLKRLDAQLALERLEIGRVQQRGDFAVVDTTIYGKLKRPLQMNGAEINEGRVSAQQFLLKENNQWKVVTADDRVRNFFLKRYPEFNKQFQLSPPQFAFKQNGQWTTMGYAPRLPR
jgi:hypothetical protein